MHVYDSDLITEAAVLAQRGDTAVLVLRKGMLSPPDLDDLRAVLAVAHCPSLPVEAPAVPRPKTGDATG